MRIREIEAMLEATKRREAEILAEESALTHNPSEHAAL
jgi:hypothetical protein